MQNMQVHDSFATGHASSDADALNERIYAELYQKTRRSLFGSHQQSWCFTDVNYSGLENDGVTIDHEVGSASLPGAAVVQ